MEGNPNLQDALLQQLRVQIESQTLKEEIKEDLRGKVDGIRQISDEVRRGAALRARAAARPAPQPPPGSTHHRCLRRLQMLSQLDEELGIEKFRTELESSQVLVRRRGRAAAVLRVE